MANLAIQHTLSIVTFECNTCGVTYGMTADFLRVRQVDRVMFYCLNGHGQSYNRGPVERLQDELDVERRRVTLANQRREAAEAEARAARGQVTKLKNRIHRGVCPHCQRTFSNVSRHMQSKHGDKE
jgi:hypothetical protein